MVNPLHERLFQSLDNRITSLYLTPRRNVDLADLQEAGFKPAPPQKAELCYHRERTVEGYEIVEKVYFRGNGFSYQKQAHQQVEEKITKYKAVFKTRSFHGMPPGLRIEACADFWGVLEKYFVVDQSVDRRRKKS